MLVLIICASVIYLTFVILNKRRIKASDPEDESCDNREHIWTKWEDNFRGSAFQHRDCKRCGIRKERMK
jgi:hypothetical protein